MTSGAETFYAVLKCYNSTLVAQFNNLTFYLRVNSEFGFEFLPRILLELFVTEAETAVLFVDFENYYLNLCTDRGELRRPQDV